MTKVTVHFAPSTLALCVVIPITLHEIVPMFSHSNTTGAMVRKVREKMAKVKAKVKVKVEGKLKRAQGGVIVDLEAGDGPIQVVSKMRRKQRAPRVTKGARGKRVTKGGVTPGVRRQGIRHLHRCFTYNTVP